MTDRHAGVSATCAEKTQNICGQYFGCAHNFMIFKYHESHWRKDDAYLPLLFNFDVFKSSMFK
jgi:hypothetical protein